jgi:hypothetical protein
LHSFPLPRFGGERWSFNFYRSGPLANPPQSARPNYRAAQAAEALRFQDSLAACYKGRQTLFPSLQKGYWMHFKLPRIGVAALVALGLAACSAQSTVPSAAPQAFAPDLVSMAPLTMHAASFGDAVSPDAKSPCNLGSSIWYFKGSCVLAAIKSAPNSVSLKAYKTYALTLSFAKSNSNNSQFILGEGTSSKDITGSFAGEKFPTYGSVPCYTIKGKVATCTGKAFLYVFVANAGANTVTFPGVPGASVTTTGAFPGTKSCSAVQIANDKTGKPVGWYLLPGSVKPTATKVSVKGFKGAFSFPTHTFTVVGFTCQ